MKRNWSLNTRFAAYLGVMILILAAGLLFQGKSQKEHDAVIRSLNADKIAMSNIISDNTAAMKEYESEISEYKTALADTEHVNAELRDKIQSVETNLMIACNDLAVYKSRENTVDNQAAIRENHMLTKEHLQTTNVESFGYYLYKPNGLYNVDMPLVLYLHGSGEGGDDLDILLNDYSVTQFIYNEELLPNAVVVIPQSPQQHWGPYLTDLMDIIRHVVATNRIDEERISIAGFSNGAVGAYAMVKTYPDFFSAVILEGMTVTQDVLETARTIPTRCFIGELENAYANSADTIENILPDYLAPANLVTVIPEYGHNTQFIWKSEQYDLFNWLISHRRYEPRKETIS